VSSKTLKKHHKERTYELSHRAFEKHQIVLLGDCVIERLPYQNTFKDQIIYNNGIEGDTTELLLDTLYQRAIKYKPSKCFISIGSNDIGHNKETVKQIYKNIREMVKALKKRSKQTEIYLLSVVPVNEMGQFEHASSSARDRDNFDIKMLNYYIRNYARKEHIGFVDVAKHLSNEFNQLNIEYTTDGFHLNEFGYEVFLQTLKKYV
jgi:lysophospholipase L1-like esterase